LFSVNRQTFLVFRYSFAATQTLRSPAESRMIRGFRLAQHRKNHICTSVSSTLKFLKGAKLTQLNLYFGT